ncbi:MAG: hypothetical protein EAX89_11090 [Candidatus Lokiarchaeota archaeon]|nr:hypothetical protein [Candidatus Lokiarchaeota archaeon]
MPNYYPDPNKNPYRVSREPVRQPVAEKVSSTNVDFDTQRICPSCGKLIKISHNFCKFCGVDLSSIPALGESDKTLKALSVAALTDLDYEVRKDAIASLEELGGKEILGVFTYVLLNDLHELVRKEAADKLGNIHNPISLDILTKALKDKSPLVRKAAIEALKKIKKMNKPPQPEPLAKKEEQPRKQEIKQEQQIEAESKNEVNDDNEDDDNEDTAPPLKEIEPSDDDMYRF